VRDLAADDPVLASLAESLLSVIEVMTREVERLTKRVLDEVKQEPTCRRLMTVPGVGPLTALAFRATIDQPGRFRKSRDAGAHLGLTPRRYQSGETDVQGRITRCGDELPGRRCMRPRIRCWYGAASGRRCGLGAWPGPVLRSLASFR
jgi:transposase